MSVALLVPVLRRPKRVKALVRSLAESVTPSSGSVRPVFIADPDDAEEIEAVREVFGANLRHHLITCEGSYARKINAGVTSTDEPLIFLGADDLNFHPGWLEAARHRLSDAVGVVGTNDLGNERVLRGEHATHSLVARWYAELGTIDGDPGLLHEGYLHNFCDTELVATAKWRGAWAFARDSIVEHLHPLWGKGELDEVYEMGQESFRRDRRLFHARSHLWT